MQDEGLGILKTLWAVDKNGTWTITGIKGLYLKPKPGDNLDYFRPQSQIEVLTNRPSPRDFLSSFGSTDFLLKQSIVPVVAVVDGESFVRCIGTAFFISCSGYVSTAAHVLLDPIEAGYAPSRNSTNDPAAWSGFTMGVLVPINPASGIRGYRFLPFTSARYWGVWKEQPLFNQRPSFAYDLDIAVCKVDPIPDMTFQPLNLSRIPIQCNQQAFALGFAEMPSFDLERHGSQTIIPDFNPELFVSVGKVNAMFPKNQSTKEVNSPGPCFRFDAFVPGRMSGGPIFGGDGEVVKGVVSTSASGERYAYGALWEPVFHLEIEGAETLRSIMLAGRSGITRIDGF